MTVDEAMNADAGNNRDYKWLYVAPLGQNHIREEIFKAIIVVKITPRGLKVIKNRLNRITCHYVTWNDLDKLDKWLSR